MSLGLSGDNVAADQTERMAGANDMKTDFVRRGSDGSQRPDVYDLFYK